MQKQIVEFQSLRGVAALVVAASHLSMVYTLPTAVRVSLDCILNAHAAVILFFVLSGYVLAASLVRNEIIFPSIAAFYVRRVFRLYPALWAISALSVVLLLTGGALKNPDSTSGWLSFFLGPFPSFQHIVLSFFALDGSLIPPRWTIAIEALGSALLPFMIIVSIKYQRAYHWLVVLLLAFAYFLADAPHHINALSYMFDFALGVLIATQPRIFRFVNALILLAGAATLIFFRVFWFAALNGRLMPLEHGYFDPIPAIVEAVGAAILIAGILNKTQGSPILRARSLVWLGDISYSLYLVHFPIMLFLVRIMSGAISGMPLWFAATATIVVGLFASLVAAAISFRFVEQPAIALGRKISDEVATWAQSKRRVLLRTG